MNSLILHLFLTCFFVGPARADDHVHGSPARRTANAQAAPTQTWEQLQARLDQLARTDAAAAADLRDYLAELDPDSRPRALSLGLELVDNMERLLALEARRDQLSPQEYAAQKRRIFSGFDSEMLRQMPGGMHDSFMRHFAPMFNRLDPDIVSQHAEHWKQSSPGGASSQFSAQQNMSANRLQAAVDDATQAVQYDPGNVSAWGILTDANYRLGNYAAAQAAATKLQQLDPGNPVATAYLKLPGHAGAQEPAAAAKILEGATALGPSEPSGLARSAAGAPVQMADPAALRSSALAKEAKESLKRRDLSLAISQAEEAVRLNPKNVEAMYYKALAYARSDMFKEALRETDRGLALAPANPALLAGRALVFNLMMLYKEALEESDKALRADPNNYHAFFTKAWALAGMGRRQDALAALKRATRLPEYAALYERALQLPADADLLPLFRGEVSPRLQAERPQEGDSRRYLIYGLLIVVLGFLIALGTLHSMYGEKSLAAGKARAGPDRRARGQAQAGAAPVLTVGAYRVLRKLGVGGMGVVYEAMDQTLERKVAIKKMREEISADPKEKERFLREARTVAKLRHPNIVEIYSIEADEDGTEAYLVFEYVDGRTLHDVIQTSRKLEYPKSLEVIRAAASALDYAHGHGVIHRDLKPSNIMLDAAGAVKVMDFGVARLAMDSLSRLAMTNTVVGTPPYMAPEQEQGAIRKESDVYALAVCLYEMLTGVLPFAGAGAGMLMSKLNKTYAPASRATAGLPPGFDEALDKALDPDPDLRYRSAGEFLAALERLSVPR